MTLILNRRGFLQTASGGLALSVIRPVGVNAQDFDGTFPDMHAACHAIIREFGSERCVWGSDFPCELWRPKVTYRPHLDIFRHKLGWMQRRRLRCWMKLRVGSGSARRPDSPGPFTSENDQTTFRRLDMLRS